MTGPGPRPVILSASQKRHCMDAMDRAVERLADDRLGGRSSQLAVLLLFRGRYDGQNLTWPTLEIPDVLVLRPGEPEPTPVASLAEIQAGKGGPSYQRVAAARYSVRTASWPVELAAACFYPIGG